MARLAFVLTAALAATAASTAAPTPTPPVIGGSNAPPGKWPDVAAVEFPSAMGEQPDCTGTLIAPTVVITAGHCDDPSEPPLPDSVLIGTSSLARPGEGETIAVARSIAFPDAVNAEDVAVLVLATASTRAPRAIATGWARADIANGAAIELVGFGAINKTGDEFVNELQEAASTITDFDCAVSPGCNAEAKPDGELGAGGMGIDTCPGDSGGPLYLTTGYGSFLAGVTSRSYDGAQFPCSGGGIYERPDKIVDWIESTSGAQVTRGPEPAAPPIVALRGDIGETQIAVNDPASTAHDFAIATPPAHGSAQVGDDGTVRVCTEPTATGSDAVTVAITDHAHPSRRVPLTIPIQLQDGAAPSPCRLDAADMAGCCDSRGGSGGSIPLAIAVAVLARRRRARPGANG